VVPERPLDANGIVSASQINLYLGFAIWTIGLGLLSSIDQNTSLAKQIGYQILTGVGAGQVSREVYGNRTVEPAADIECTPNDPHCRPFKRR
jgi:hypothetical protein